MAASLVNRGGRLYLRVKGKIVSLGFKITAKTTGAQLKSKLNQAAGRLASTLSDSQLGEFGSLLNKPAAALLTMAKKSVGRTRRRTARGARISKVTKPKVLSSKKVAQYIRMALIGNKDKIQILAKNKTSLEKYLSNSRNNQKIQKSLFLKMGKLPKLAGQKLKDGSTEYGYITTNIAGLLPDIVPYEVPFNKPKNATKWASAIRLSMRLYLSDFIPNGNAEFKTKLSQIYGSTLPSITTKQKEDESYIQSQLGTSSNLLGGLIDANLFLAASTYILVNRFKKNNLYKSILKKMDLSAPVAQKPGIPNQALYLKTPVVAVFGASTTAVEIGDKIGYVRELEKRLRTISKKVIVDAYGHGGDTTTAIARRFESGLSNRNYNIVVIQGGINDSVAYRTNSSKSKQIVDTATNNLDKMVKFARAKGMRVILFTIHPYKYPTPEVGRRIDAINKWIMAQGKRVGVSAIKVPRLDKAGSLHPAMKDRAIIGRMIFEQLTKKKIPVVKAPLKTSKVSPEEIELVKKSIELANSVLSSKPAPLSLLNQFRDSAKKPVKKTIEFQQVALQRLFNNLKKRDRRFMAFLAIYDEFSNIRSSSGDLLLNAKDAKAGLANKAILKYLNFRANVGSWKLENLNWDIKAQNVEQKRKGETKLPVKGDNFKTAMLGISILQWRGANPLSKGGAWAKKITLEKATTPKRRLIR